MTAPTPLYSGEAILLSWGESHRDGRVVRFKIEEDGTHPFKGLDTGVERGQRFMLVAVPIQNDGGPAKAEGAVSAPTNNGDRISKPNSTRAVMMAKDRQFWGYLGSRGIPCTTEVEADAAIKYMLNIKSKSDLNDEGSHAATIFGNMRADFSEWKRKGGYA